MAAVRLEPLRESAHRVLAEVHLGEGNIVEAVRVFRDYRTRIARELGVDAVAAVRRTAGRLRAPRGPRGGMTRRP